MPVKVRCNGCEKVLNAPDKARGKVVKCPNCAAKIKIPAGKRKPVPSAAPPPDSDSDFLADLDLDRAEDRSTVLCPNCATELEMDQQVCHECGTNVTTGRLDEKIARKRARKGPDPNLFYKKAWSDSWRFVKSNKTLALRTGLAWAVFGVLNAFCAYMAIVVCERMPPKVFWFGLTFLTALGIPGWYWYLSQRVIEITLEKKDTIKRLHVDFFQTVALGIKSIVWPFLMMLPVLPLFVFAVTSLGVGATALLGGVGAAGGVVTAFLLGLLFGLFPLLVLPLALIHMTQKYTYKVWIFYEMLKVFVKNAAPTIYWFVMAFLLYVVPTVGLSALMFYSLGATNPLMSPELTGLKLVSVEGALQFDADLGLTGRITNWFLKTIGETPRPEGWMFMAIKGLLNILFTALILAPFWILIAFPAVFLMRANGLLGYYRQRHLDLVNRMPANTPATFWVRFFAGAVDYLLTPLTSFLVTKEKKAVMIAWLLNAVGLILIWTRGVELTGMIMGPIWSTYNLWMYFAIQDSSSQRTTVGKDAFGLIVNTEDHKQLSLKQASQRFGAMLLSVLTLGIGFIMCAAHPRKKALHDIITKTEVVWAGDK